MRKKFRQKYGLFVQNKYLYIISSFYQKTIDTSEDQTSQVRHSKSMGIYGFSYMAEMARKSYSSQENPEILVIK